VRCEIRLKLKGNKTMTPLEKFYEENLVCPKTHEALTFSNGSIVTAGGRTYRFENQIPSFLDSATLTEHQSSELESAAKYIRAILNNADPNYSPDRPYDQPEFCWKWTEKWLNANTVKPDTKIVCIGGAFTDDLPQVRSSYKFNIDHLASEYVKLFPVLLNANTHHIACTSETLPFRDNYADFVYARNSLDHVCNPVQTLKEIHRILKPQGRFIAEVYYTSNIINEHESTSVDDEFIAKCIEPVLSIEHSFIGSGASPTITLVGQKKPNGNMPFTQQETDAVGKILSYFHSALRCERTGRVRLAAQNYACISQIQPVFRTDAMRIVYSLIRLYGITDHLRFNALKQVVERLFGSGSSLNGAFEKTITDYSIQSGNNMVCENLSSCVKILDAPNYIEGKQILRNLIKLADGYLDKAYAANIRNLAAAECSIC
jgi:SAM-dependent methyltransferase